LAPAARLRYRTTRTLPSGGVLRRGTPSSEGPHRALLIGLPRYAANDVSIDAPAVTRDARRHRHDQRSDHPSRVANGLALVLALVCLVLLGAQVSFGWSVLHSNGLFTALAAHKYVWANALAAVLVAAVAIVGRGRWRWLAVIGPGAYLLAILLATAIPGGQILAMVTAIFTMAALWDTGERLLRRLGAVSLSRIALVAWLAGIGPWSLGIVILGRVSLVKWWTVGILLVVTGTIGSVRLGARVLANRRSIAREVGGSAMTLASAGLILLTLGWVAIYTAAPEIQFDALYAKAYLPELWARTGHIVSSLQHVQFAITGWFQVLATSGHLLGATAVGRYMQLIGLVCAASAVWWWGRRHGAIGPLAAVAVVVTPHLLWQASTAYDDLLLALCALAFCVAIVESLRAPQVGQARGLAFALGLMAGSGPSLKLHLVPLFAFLLLGWIAAGRASGSITRRFGYAAVGAAITGLPPLVLRWIDTGNPVLPAYNNIFRSRYWLPVNEKLNFPFWPHPGAFGPISVIWKAVVEPKLMTEDAPPGAFGVLIGATVIALLLGWLGRDRARAARVVWIALIPAIVFWWVSFRYLRYLLPISFVSVALVLMLTSDVTLTKRSLRVGILGVTLATIASFPVTISQFWNVPTHKPPVYAAIGRWKASSYEEAAFSERPAILAFNRLAPRGARMATTAFERVWFTQERDFYSLDYEMTPLIELQGPLPTTGDTALRAMRKLGVGWVLVTGADRLLNEPGYLSQVLTAHGKIEFSERGWDLYRLVDRPPRPIPLSACDRAGHGVPACWGGPRTADGGLIVSATRTVPVCAGETLAVSLAEAQGGGPASVFIEFTGGNPQDGVQPGEVVPGHPQWIYATTPSGVTSASIIVNPTGGAKIISASIGRLGRSCSSHFAPA
jgi:hypothetical protein